MNELKLDFYDFMYYNTQLIDDIIAETLKLRLKIGRIEDDELTQFLQIVKREFYFEATARLHCTLEEIYSIVDDSEIEAALREHMINGINYV